MHRHRFADPGALFAFAVAFAAGCAPSPSEILTGKAAEAEDGAFPALQARGAQAMGLDQYTSTHLFDALPDGGRIELQRDVDDPAGVEEIRGHLGKIAEAFASGDFSTPAFVHLRELLGTAVMAANKDRIEYVYRELPRGAELRLVTNDPDAIRAIHEFMAFHREHHRAGGAHAGATDHGTMHHGRHGGHTRGGDTP
jgi:hypothetical protein